MHYAYFIFESTFAMGTPAWSWPSSAGAGHKPSESELRSRSSSAVQCVEVRITN
jgi:hypothetical protein